MEDIAGGGGTRPPGSTRPSSEVGPREEQLVGGNISGPVRIGDEVHRAAGPWTPAVHALLRYLESQAFEAPRPLGFDQAGREVLSYVDGDAATYPMADYVWSDATLVRTGELLRRYHDLSMGFDPPPDAVWRARAPDPGEHEVICHSDWGPYNAVFRSGRLAVMIDWDFAGPGSRLWDLAWVAHSWCPLTRPAPHYGPAPAEPAEQARRLRLLSDAYGVDDRAALVDVLWERVRATPGWIEERAADGEPAFASMVASGHHDFYRRVLVYMDSIRPAVDAALS